MSVKQETKTEQSGETIERIILSFLAAVGFLAPCRLVETQAVIRIGHNCLPALEVCAQHKWMAFHPGDYGSGFHSNLEHKQEAQDHTNGRKKTNVNSVSLLYVDYIHL